MLYLISWLTDFAAILFVFAGTRHLAERGASPMLLGVLGAAFFLASAISNACSGRLADRVGRRRVALCGLALFLASLGSLSIIPVGSTLYYGTYVLVGVSVGLIYPAVMAWIGLGKSGQVAGRAYLWFCLAFNLGIVSAQLSGGWLFETIGPRAPMQVAMVLTLTGLGCMWILRDPGLQHDSQRPDEDESHDASLARAFTRLTWIANFGGMFSMSILWFLLPVLVVELKVSAAAHGILLAVGRVVVIATYCAMYFLPHWQFRFRVAVAVQLIGIAGLVAISLAGNSLTLSLGIAALSALMGYNYYASLFYNAHGAAPQQKGRAFGLNEAALGLGAAGGSLLGGWLGSDWGIRSPFQLAAGLVMALLLVQAFVHWQRIRPLRLSLGTAQRADLPSSAGQHAYKHEAQASG